MQLINFTKWDSEPYSEISQKNKMRWMNVKPVGEDTYEPVSHWWKCKDFMNEVVTSFHLRKPFRIYGFSVDPKTFFAEGQVHLYLIVKNILPAWEHNMQLINKYVMDKGMPPVVYQQQDSFYLLTLNNAYLQNTFFMSAITLLIRMANVETKHNSVEDIFKDEENSADHENIQAVVKKDMGSFPNKLKEYLWYYPSGDGLKKTEKDNTFSTSMMHNCGVVSWGWV